MPGLSHMLLEVLLPREVRPTVSPPLIPPPMFCGTPRGLGRDQSSEFIPPLLDPLDDALDILDRRDSREDALDTLD